MFPSSTQLIFSLLHSTFQIPSPSATKSLLHSLPDSTTQSLIPEGAEPLRAPILGQNGPPFILALSSHWTLWLSAAEPNPKGPMDGAVCGPYCLHLDSESFEGRAEQCISMSTIGEWYFKHVLQNNKKNIIYIGIVIHLLFGISIFIFIF